MDVGPAKVRRRTTAGVTKFTIGLKLTRTQVALLDSFFRDSAKGGALAFQWKHPRTGNPIDYRFAEVPKLRPLAPRQAAGKEYWVATFSLEALPGTEITDVDPPINPTPIPAHESVYLWVATEAELVEEILPLFLGPYVEADAAPAEAFIGMYIDIPVPDEPDAPSFVGAAFFVQNTGGTIPGGPGGETGGGGPGGGIN